MNKSKWLIWSIEHNAWWAPAHRGYVPDMASAGIYSYEEALKIVHNANLYALDVPNEAMVFLYED